MPQCDQFSNGYILVHNLLVNFLGNEPFEAIADAKMEAIALTVDLVLSVLSAAVYIWVIVRIVNWWHSPDGDSERRRKRGAMFWMTIVLLAIFPLFLAAAFLFGWLAKVFK